MITTWRLLVWLGLTGLAWCELVPGKVTEFNTWPGMLYVGSQKVNCTFLNTKSLLLDTLMQVQLSNVV